MVKLAELIDMMRKLKSPYITINNVEGSGIFTKIREYASSHDLKVFELRMNPFWFTELEGYPCKDENPPFLYSEEFKKINNDEYIMVITDIESNYIDRLTHQILHRGVKPLVIFLTDIEPEVPNVADVLNNFFKKE